MTAFAVAVRFAHWCPFALLTGVCSLKLAGITVSRYSLLLNHSKSFVCKQDSHKWERV